MIMYLDLIKEFIDCNHTNFRPRYFFQYLEVSVVGDDVFGIGSNGTINKLIVINIFCNKVKMHIYILKPGCG